jgi:hypothetical protein
MHADTEMLTLRMRMRWNTPSTTKPTATKYSEKYDSISGLPICAYTQVAHQHAHRRVSSASYSQLLVDNYNIMHVLSAELQVASSS